LQQFRLGLDFILHDPGLAGTIFIFMAYSKLSLLSSVISKISYGISLKFSFRKERSSSIIVILLQKLGETNLLRTKTGIRMAESLGFIVFNPLKWFSSYQPYIQYMEIVA